MAYFFHNEYTPTLKCNQETNLIVGLLSYDEAVLSGLNYGSNYKLNIYGFSIDPFPVTFKVDFILITGRIATFYKMQKEFDVIKTQIGSYTMGDIRVAVLVDGKETDTCPSYETNYKVERIECSNGVSMVCN